MKSEGDLLVLPGLLLRIAYDCFGLTANQKGVTISPRDVRFSLILKGRLLVVGSFSFQSEKLTFQAQECIFLLGEK
jgi:hypothetical protein